jgi:hypothetical protein
MTRGRRILTWLQSVAVFCCLLALAATAGCSSSLREVRARGPEFQFPGVAASRQLEVARCIRDVLDQGAGEEILQEIERGPDGMHVIGRPDQSLSAAVLYDVAVREDAVVAVMAPASLVPRETLRGAVAACLSEAPGGGGKK